MGRCGRLSMRPSHGRGGAACHGSRASCMVMRPSNASAERPVSMHAMSVFLRGFSKQLAPAAHAVLVLDGAG